VRSTRSDHRAAIVIAAIALIAGACSRETSAGTGGDNGNAWTKPGIVRLAVNTDVNSFNPIISRLYIENYVEEGIFSGLVKYDAAGDLVPDLATAVPTVRNGGISADGKTITYHLRPDARWQDGVPVTASDVRFTYQLYTDPRSASPVASTYDRVVAVDTPDAHTVVLHLRAPYAPILSNMFCNGAFGEIVPEHILAKSRDIARDPFDQHPIGSGPYRLVRWDHGTAIILAANPQYFGGEPKVREIDVEILPNSNSQLIGIEAHQLDVVTQAEPAQIASYRAISGVRVTLAPTQAETFLSYNLTRAPFDDIRVRRALAMALDRTRIAQTGFVGTAVPAQTLIPPTNWAYDADNGAVPFDPSGAARLLDAAGWRVGPDGIRTRAGRRFEFGLVHSTSQIANTVSEEIERTWTALGADVHLRTAPRNVLVGDIEPNGAFDVDLDAVGFDADPDRSQYTETAFEEPHGSNIARYSDADVDRWTVAALTTYDRAQRRHYYALIQRRLNRDLPYVPIAWEQFVYVENTDLRGLEPETVNSDFWNVQDWTI